MDKKCHRCGKKYECPTRVVVIDQLGIILCWICVNKLRQEKEH